jgi:hypothetical protein
MAFIYPTLEVRWLEFGTLPAQLRSWFDEDCSGELLRLSEEREDLYLLEFDRHRKVVAPFTHYSSKNFTCKISLIFP